MKKLRYGIAVAAAGALTIAGCASAAATSTATQKSAKTIASKSVPPVPTWVTAYAVDTDVPVLSAIVSGPVLGDSGSADEVPPGSSVVTRHAADLLLKLAHGTFRLDIADIGTRFTKALGPANLASTCSDYVSVSGRVPIVPGSGTGAYRGIAGTFNATMTVNELHHVPCNPSVTTYRQLVWLNGSGTITMR
jgi:hypothetical protein